jgi:hypothetical protein
LRKGEIILPGSPLGNEIGFTCDLFEGSLIKNGNTIEVAFIKSIFPSKGNFLNLLKNVKSRGYEIKVLLPSFQMQKILRKQGFRQTRSRCNRLNAKHVYNDTIEYCSTWYIPKKKQVVENVKA